MGSGTIRAAHMAGHDPRARVIFDGLWSLALAHPSDIDDRLVQWKVRPGGNDASGDSAFDAGCDTAYAPPRAEARWGNDAAIDYRQAFDRPIAGSEAATIGPASDEPPLGDRARPAGSDANDPHTQRTLRASDFVPGHFRAFRRKPAARFGTGCWRRCKAWAMRCRTGSAR